MPDIGRVRPEVPGPRLAGCCLKCIIDADIPHLLRAPQLALTKKILLDPPSELQVRWMGRLDALIDQKKPNAALCTMDL
jgi:hypothetical protein